MLSTSAFNALLKTLEEPPEHVKFVFATTEIRKVPVTVLSRCQRFDLRRIEPEAMLAHLRGIATAEAARISDEALALITRAAEGSVRDALSLLDQAIAHGNEGGETGAAEVRAMLGLADRGRVIDLFEAIMRGDAKAALAELSAQYADGADPAVVLRDLAELTHWISVLKISDEAAEDPTVAVAERARGRDLAARLSMRVLTRAWQMLLKAIEEVPVAPTAMMAAEMAVIRLTHVADLPPPEELMRRLTEGGPGAGGGALPGPRGGGGGPAARLTAVVGGAPRPAPAALPDPALEPYTKIEDVTGLLRQERDIKLLHEVETGLRLIRFKPGLIEFNPAPGAPADLAGRLSQRLRDLTGARWTVLVSAAEGQPTLAEQAATAKRAEAARASGHPLVLAALEAFPGAEIRDVRPLGGAAAPEEFLAPAPEREFIEIEGDLVDHDDSGDDPGYDPFEEDI
jgi:DNA polymerase-3 subunit gamma/tau